MKAALRSYSLCVNTILLESSGDIKNQVNQTPAIKNRTLPPAWTLKSWLTKGESREGTTEEVGRYLLDDTELTSLIVWGWLGQLRTVPVRLMSLRKKKSRRGLSRIRDRTREQTVRENARPTRGNMPGMSDFGSRRERKEWRHVLRVAKERRRGQGRDVSVSTPGLCRKCETRQVFQYGRCGPCLKADGVI